MSEFLQQLVNGVTWGSVYALIALGYTMVYGILRLINFAHGDVYMLGAFFAYFAARAMGAGTDPSPIRAVAVLLIAMAGCGIVGLVIERGAYKPVRRSSRLAALITAIGVSLLLENGGVILFGADPKFFPQIVTLKTIPLGGGVSMTNQQLIVLVVSLGLMLLLRILVLHTKVGRAMRAVSFNHTAAALMGISVDRIISFTFMVGSMLAAAAGVLVALQSPKIEPYMGIMPGLKAFVAAVLGGIGNLPGAVLGGLVMGIAEVMVVGYVSPTYRDAIAFVLLILILLLRPAGILGRNVAEKSESTMRAIAWFAGSIVALLALNFALPRLFNPYIVQVVMLCGINVILAVSLNLINGFTGQFSIGHAGFMAIGAYASAMMTLHGGSAWAAALQSAGLPAPLAQGGPLLTALIGGGLVAAAAGYLVGLPSLRLRGDYLAIVTLGFGEIIRVLILNINAVGGARGLPGIPGWANFFWVGGAMLVVILVARHLATSTHGRALFAIRDDEVAAEALGVNTTRYKVVAFVIGAFFAGVAGGLFAHYLSYLNPNSFTFLKSIEVIAMVVLGGMGSVSGSVFAAIVLTLLPELLRPVKSYRMVIYSLMLIVLMITRPQGLLGTREFSFSMLRRRRAAAA